MLYEGWRQIARTRPNEWALRDLAAGRVWTFAGLDAASEGPPTSPGPVAFPQGISAEFVIAVLRAWRNGQIVCPLEGGQEPPPLALLPPGCAHLKTTSASTGTARCVAFTAEQLAADAENIVATMGLRANWPNVGVISLAHSYGFSNLVLPLLLHGIPLSLAASPLPEGVRHATAIEAAVTLAAVPALWRAWHDADAIPPNVKLAISAGASLPLPLEQAVFDRHGLKIHNFYGASECGGIAYDRATTPRTDSTCVGAPLEQVKLTRNAEGCLEVRSRAVGQSYWPEPEDALGDGCFRTCDLVELRDGCVFLRGRASDLINIAGRKISPETIERALLAHPSVRACLVFGAPSHDTARTETIVAVVAAKDGTKTEELKQFLLGTLPAWQVPREWVLVDALQTNQRGKLSRAQWRQKFFSGEL